LVRHRVRSAAKPLRRNGLRRLSPQPFHRQKDPAAEDA
jgi:hypothetical protein